MLLSKKTTVSVTDTQSNYIGHMCYAAYKLWNVCNYERRHYKELGMDAFPDWYVQKSAHKDDMWYKSLPSQSAQETIKILDGAWKSFFRLMKTGNMENPRPPRFKQSGIPVTYMQNGIFCDGDTVRFTLSKSLKSFMEKTYRLHESFLILKNPVFEIAGTIKQIKLYPPEDGCVVVIIVYEVPDAEPLPDNGRYLSIDIGMHNLMTCYDNAGTAFIVGRMYLSICRRFDKEIARIQSQWAKQQQAKGIRYPKLSKHARALYEKKRNCVKDYLHKVTRAIVNYCREHDIHTVIVGDITGIRENYDCGDAANQEFHSLPYRKFCFMLEYKLAMEGFRLIRQPEPYSSQCSPMSASVNKKCANKDRRVERGLYVENGTCWNADAVGAYNILRLYLNENNVGKISVLSSPALLKVAV